MDFLPFFRVNKLTMYRLLNRIDFCQGQFSLWAWIFVDFGGKSDNHNYNWVLIVDVYLYNLG